MAVIAIAGGRVQSQAPAVDPESLAGFWETSTSGSIDGLSLSFSYSPSIPGRTPDLLIDIRRSLQIRVYHRLPEPETWGWHLGPPDFDGRRLAVAGFDVTFQSEQRQWIGTLTRAGQTREVVLERPRPGPGLSPHPLAGDWTAEQDPSETLKQGGRLHIAQSSDGTVNAWLDRFLAPFDERRYGELLRMSTENDGVRLLLTQYITGPPIEYRGTVSVDRLKITGSWFRRGDPSPKDSWKLNAPTIFVRLPERAVGADSPR